MRKAALNFISFSAMGTAAVVETPHPSKCRRKVKGMSTHSDASVCSGPTAAARPQQTSCHILCEVCTLALGVRLIFPSRLRVVVFKVDFRSEQSEGARALSQLGPARPTGGGTLADRSCKLVESYQMRWMESSLCFMYLLPVERKLQFLLPTSHSKDFLNVQELHFSSPLLHLHTFQGCV